MVSFHTPLSQKTRAPELESSSKKRKWEDGDHYPQAEAELFDKKSKSLFDIQTPLPLEWQRCLDIQSGKVHFLNTRTQKRTSRDPRISPEPAGHMSLDLELNLTCESLRKNHGSNHHENAGKSENSVVLGCSPSWLALDEGDGEEEMVATVCKRCFMLVMLCKSCPACPNCKFMHPLDQSSPNLFKRRMSLLF